jgi:hypothetical protein
MDSSSKLPHSESCTRQEKATVTVGRAAVAGVSPMAADVQRTVHALGREEELTSLSCCEMGSTSDSQSSPPSEVKDERQESKDGGILEYHMHDRTD